MRTIKPVGRYARDEKRVKAGVYGRQFQKVDEALEMLALDLPLPDRFRDHALSHEYQGCRDCHIRPDLILIYRKPDDQTLELIRLGSHSELFR